MKKGKIITSLDDLKKYSSDNNFECYIMLNFGARSSKTITYYPSDGSWSILNEIDGSDEDYGSDQELIEGYPLLIEAIEKHALIAY